MPYLYVMLSLLKLVIIVCFTSLFHSLVGQGYVSEPTEVLNFVYGPGEYGAGPSFVDIDNDGDDDLTFPSGNSNGLHFFKSNDGTFVEATPSFENTTETKQMLWVDYDNDGDLDLYVCSRFMNRLYKNNGGFEFEDITLTCGFANPNEQSFCATWLDYDNDGLLDICVSHRTSYLVGQITLYKNLGSDQFEDVTIAAGLNDMGNSVLAMAALDFNNDGFEDLYVGQDFDAGNLLLKNHGDGTFTNVSGTAGTGVQNNTMTCTIGDFNNDSWMDIYVTNTNPGNSFYINQGDETFIESAVEYGIVLEQFTWGAVFVDADNDMDLDLYINGIDVPFQPNSKIFENNLGEEIPFTLVNDEWGMDDDPVASVGNAIGDFNSDGFVDIVKMNNGSFHTLWKNTFEENAYLHIDLEGEISNSMAVGAVVEVVAGDVHQFRRVGCGEGFSSQNSYTQFFGLGQHFVADSIVVSWPSGLTSVLVNIPADQSITINELDTFGCIDEMACNYNSNADWNDGTCDYPLDFFDCDGFCINDTDGDGICDEFEILGCQDELACNYSPDATDEDGSCEYVELHVIEGEVAPWLEMSFSYAYENNDGSSYEWLVENGEITTGNGSSMIEVIWEVEGIHLLSVRETTSDDCVGDWVDLEVSVSLVGISETAILEADVFPNPVMNQLNVKFPFHSSSTIELVVYDSKGKIVPTTFEIQGASLMVNVADLSAGMYFATVSNNSIFMKFKFIVERY